MARFGFYHEDNEKNRLRSVTRWLVDILAVTALAIFLVNELGGTRTVSGHSMQPVLDAGDRVLLDVMSYRLSDVKRYDVVLFTVDEENGRESIKRVIGLPGETVWIDGGRVYIDGEILEDEKHELSVSIAGAAAEPVTLGEEEYFLIGDNGYSSEDSRFVNIGNISRSQIEGKVWFCIAPLESVGPVR